MDFSYNVTLNLVAWLALTGLAQSLLILVHITFRARSFRQAALPISYFLCLALAFALQFALLLEEYEAQVRLALWLVWTFSIPLSCLLILQIAERVSLPPARHFRLLALPPLALLGAFGAQGSLGVCADGDFPCARFFDWLYWLGAMAGGLSLLTLWWRGDPFGKLKERKGGRERYWLSIALIAVNILVLAAFLLRSAHGLDARDMDSLLVMSGIAFSYLATTTLLRVYPLPVQLNDVPRLELQALNPEEKALAEQVRKLLEVDKVYQEPAFGRADLARELKVSESRLSHVINRAFGKNVPQLLNEFRINDAKNMLRDPFIPVNVVATEAGFNSIASFNRVFREITGETPTSWREGNGK